MTLVASTKPFTISLHHHAKRKGRVDLNSRGPIPLSSFESQVLSVAVLTMVAEPVDFNFFCLKNSGSQTSACI